MRTSRRVAMLKRLAEDADSLDFIDADELSLETLEEEFPEELEADDLDLLDACDCIDADDDLIDADDDFVDADDDFVDADDDLIDADDELLEEELAEARRRRARRRRAEEVFDADEFELPEDKDDEAILSDDDGDFVDADEYVDELLEEELAEARRRMARRRRAEDLIDSADDGIEEEIGDEAGGGDPSMSEVADSDIDVSTDAEVFPTNSEYVSRITKRLDRVANILEKRGNKKMAYRVDILSDKLDASVRRSRR